MIAERGQVCVCVCVCVRGGGGGGVQVFRVIKCVHAGSNVFFMIVRDA